MTMHSTPYILLVEDNPGDAGLVRYMFDEAPPGTLPELLWERSAQAAVGRLLERPDCSGVLLDLGLPDSQALQALTAIVEHAGAVPIVVLSGNDDEEVGVAAVVAGAQDYLVKGTFDAALLRRALQYATHRKRVERELLVRALHDHLTGLPTRALLLDRLRMAIGAAARNDSRGALLFVDLDRFKQVNDHHGHAAGDAVLRAVARRMEDAVRSNDTVARVGGDEFVVLLPVVTNDDDSELVARKLLLALAEPVEFGSEFIVSSASVGLVEFIGQAESAEALIALADQAMYEAKRAGRATVRLA